MSSEIDWRPSIKMNAK